MRWQVVTGWIAALWLATGVEGALGTGMPGPLFMMALAAGLSTGLAAGLLVGLLAGLCESAVSGHPLLPATLACMGAGAFASLLPRWFSPRNILIGAVAALLTSTLYAGVLALAAHQSLPRVAEFAARRGGVNGLWMIAIYSIVLVASPRTSRQPAWEE